MYTLFFNTVLPRYTIVSSRSKCFDDFNENESSIVEQSTIKTISSYLVDIGIDPLAVKVMDK
jgi:hypothetical protein